jgi:hypothetical protein
MSSEFENLVEKIDREVYQKLKSEGIKISET